MSIPLIIFVTTISATKYVHVHIWNIFSRGQAAVTSGTMYSHNKHIGGHLNCTF